MPIPDPFFPDAVENLDVATAQANWEAAWRNAEDARTLADEWQNAAAAWKETLGQMMADEAGWAVGDYFQTAGHTYRVYAFNLGQADGQHRLRLMAEQVNKDGTPSKRGRNVAPMADQVKKVGGPDA